MRPLNGIVVSRGAVKCENGLTLTTHIPSHIKLFEKVYVCFNLYTNRISRIISTKEGDKENVQDLPQQDIHPACKDEMFVEAKDYDEGSETLEPMFLELSSPYSEEEGF